MKTKQDKIIEQFEQLINEETDKTTRELLKMTLVNFITAEIYKENKSE